MRSASLDIKTTIRGPVPRIPFDELARHVLGSHYQLSLVICGDALARRINTAYRKKTYAPNVLSFPLERGEGEIFLNIRKAEREARSYATTLRARLSLLYVHGLYHLKGLDHGDHMERLEQAALKKFGLA
jgi:probable rRNA maturation factor